MSLGTLTLHAHQGEERFDFASASVTFQPNGDGRFATTFRIETAPPPAKIVIDAVFTLVFNRS